MTRDPIEAENDTLLFAVAHRENHPDEDAEDADDAAEFLREVARVEELPPPTPLPIAGQSIGRFRILSELGRGGMGIVYLAHDESLRRAVALKLLAPGVTQQDERRRRFLREARAAASVTHPNLATIYDVGEVDGTIFIAMERIEGRTLRKVIAGRQLPLEEAATIAAQLLAGLAKAHRAGIVHRDLKPDNIMITEEGVAKILDFGLAKQHGEPAEPDSGGLDTLPRDTATDQLLGTPGYMSPEQLRGAGIDPRSDIFSFGVIFYEMLAGARPFRGRSSADLQSAILRDEPAPLSRARSDLPRAVEGLIARCLEKDRAARFPDCADVAAALSELALDGGRLSGPASTLPRAASLARASGADGARPRGAWRGAALAALAIAGGLALLALVRRATPQGATEAALVSMAPAPAPRGKAVAVTDLPLPESRSPEALAAYGAAMQGIRDGNWGYVTTHLERALQHDPGLAIAHLRLAIVHQYGPMLGQVRSEFGRALLGRHRLSERDQALLHAFEPVLYRDPPDWREHLDRLRQATERFPQDAELHEFLAYQSADDPAQALRAAGRAVELDPLYADGWQLLGRSLFSLGRTEEALRALERCIALSPATADCRGERGLIHGTEGRCEEMDEDLRHAVASSQRGVWHDDRAMALHALGHPPEAVLQVYRNKWAQLPEERREVIELQDRSQLALALGRFDEAAELVLAAQRLVASDPEAITHANLAQRLIAIYLETGRSKEAGRVADQYLERRHVWISSEDSDALTIGMYWTLLRAGLIDRQTFIERRSAWLAEHAADGPGLSRAAQLGNYAGSVETPEEAAETLALFADVEPPKVPSPALAAFGRLHLLTGKPDAALPFLEKMVRTCLSLMSPRLHAQAALQLGQAREALADREGACAAYADVIERWGSAQPPSVTAGSARSRARALRCEAPVRR